MSLKPRKKSLHGSAYESGRNMTRTSIVIAENSNELRENLDHVRGRNTL